MIDADDLRRLLQWLDLTTADEIDCEEFLARVAGVVERLRPDEPPPPGAEAVLHHLKVCPECDEEFRAVLRALRGEHGGGARRGDSGGAG